MINSSPYHKLHILQLARTLKEGGTGTTRCVWRTLFRFTAWWWVSSDKGRECRSSNHNRDDPSGHDRIKETETKTKGRKRVEIKLKKIKIRIDTDKVESSECRKEKFKSCFVPRRGDRLRRIKNHWTWKRLEIGWEEKLCVWWQPAGEVGNLL